MKRFLGGSALGLTLIGFAMPALWLLAIPVGLLAIGSRPSARRTDGSRKTGGLLGWLLDDVAMAIKMRECPHCRTTIPKASTKCAHCGEWTDDPARNSAPLISDIEKFIRRRWKLLLSCAVLIAVMTLASKGPEGGIPQEGVPTKKPKEIATVEAPKLVFQANEEGEQSTKSGSAYSASYIAQKRKNAGQCYFPNKLRDPKILDFMGELIRSQNYKCEFVARGRFADTHRGRMVTAECEGLLYNVLIPQGGYQASVSPDYGEFWPGCE